MRNHILILIITVLITSNLTSQNSLQFHIGASIPQDEFGDTDEDNWINEGSGHAKTGINVGLKYLKSLKTDNLYFTLSADVFFNDLTSDAKDEFDSDNWEFITPKYFNIPVLIGLNYSYPIQEDFGIYGEGGIGVNLMKITDLKATYQKEDYNESISFSLSPKLAYKFCIGINLKEKYNIGINYFGLGAHKCEMTFENSDGDSETIDFKNSLEIGILSISAGIKL